MVFNTYGKGARAERELIAILVERGFSVIRAAGSGVNSLSPDILGFKHGAQFAFECKAVENTSLLLDKDQFGGLRRWEENTGITTLVAWRRNREDWKFLPLNFFHETGTGWAVSWKGKAEHAPGKDDLLK